MSQPVGGEEETHRLFTRAIRLTGGAAFPAVQNATNECPDRPGRGLVGEETWSPAPRKIGLELGSLGRRPGAVETFEHDKSRVVEGHHPPFRPTSGHRRSLTTGRGVEKGRLQAPFCPYYI